jgi:hypothetical protein
MPVIMQSPLYGKILTFVANYFFREVSHENKKVKLFVRSICWRDRTLLFSSHVFSPKLLRLPHGRISRPLPDNSLWKMVQMLKKRCMNFISQILNRQSLFLVISLALLSRSAIALTKYRYADPSSYAISLYGVNATTLKFVAKNPSGFLQFTKSGAASWQITVHSAGLYRIRAIYACDDTGIKLRVSTGEHSFNFDLPGTHGYYIVSSRTTPHGALWPHGIGDAPMQNYNRLDLGKSIPLKAGRNSIVLVVTVPIGHIPFFLRSLELLPVGKLAEAQAETRKAKMARANPDWLMHAGYGLMFHWTLDTMPHSGPQMKYADAVNSFNVPAFADMVKKTGASYIIFTANHVNPHFPAPLKEWEAVHPGWTTKRDLIGEIADALNTRGIKLILYIHVQSMADPTWKNDRRTVINGTLFADTAIKLISEVGNRYGTRVAGYWFDSFGDIETEYPDFPYKRFYQASKNGNPTRLVSVTNWIYPIATDWQDYWGGEVFVIGAPPSQLPQRDGPAKGLPFHALLALNGNWIHTAVNSSIKPPIFTADELSSFIKRTRGKGSVTVDAPIYQDGSIGKEQRYYFEQLQKRVYGH